MPISPCKAIISSVIFGPQLSAAAFVFFGGVPTQCICNNMKMAVDAVFRWWNSLSEPQHLTWLNAADFAKPADAWAEFKWCAGSLQGGVGAYAKDSP